MTRSRKIKVKTLDLSEADGYAITEKDIIFKAVEKAGFKDRPLLFSGLEGENLASLLKQGTLHPCSDYVFATGSPDVDEGVEECTTPISCAFEKNKPMLAVYDRTKFKSVHCNKYKFIDPSHKLESLLIVYFLR